MQQQEIHEFLIKFFKANDCPILENSPGHLKVQLTIELDKELMNRPFYWHYLEKTGGIPNPSQLTFITDKERAPEGLKGGEIIHFGSPRLHQIFESTKKIAGYIRLYENHRNLNVQTPMYPWLCMNVKISYQCDRKRDIFKSIGLQLINGRMVEDFHDRLMQVPLTPKIPDYSYTLSPLVKPKSGMTRVETYLRGLIDGDDHSWADAARERWDKDLKLLEHFYEDVEEEENESYATEKKALQEQYEPKINISFINGGLFYLTERAI